MSATDKVESVASDDIQIAQFKDESELTAMMALISKDLSEPYSVFTYRHFTSEWPQLCFNAYLGDVMVGTILCREENRKGAKRGYIAMLVVDTPYRKLKIGSRLASAAISRMVETCDEVVLETEVTNEGALRLYESLGFIRDKRLPKYYMNGNDAYRLKCWMK